MGKKKDKKNRKAKCEACAMQAAMAPGMNGNRQGGFLGGLAGMLPSGRNEQFLLGAAVGAVAAYLLSDEELRGKLMKSGINLYANLMGGIAELKEQMSDVQAEVEAERQGLL